MNHYLGLILGKKLTRTNHIKKYVDHESLAANFSYPLFGKFSEHNFQLKLQPYKPILILKTNDFFYALR